MRALLATALLLLIPVLSQAQVPVDDDGNVIGKPASQADITPILSAAELQELVGPVALYPDDLLAIVLPASAYPLQIVQAARFLEALKNDSSLQPDPDWDDSVVALTNYPEVIDLLNNDLDWTWKLGEAIVAQQADVIAAIETFRDTAYAAGNLKSDEYQTVSNDDGVIEISPVAEDVIYVPYYEPSRVVVYQPYPVYHYYPHAYPVYYYPYSVGHHFDHGFFWGVTTAFSIGWFSDSLHVYHHSYHGHPYYGHHYRDNWWYRRPTINVYNTTYVGGRTVTVNHYSNGDRWRPRSNRRQFVRREGYVRAGVRSSHRSGTQSRDYQPIAFRDREVQPATRSHETRTTRTRSNNSTVQSRDSHREEPVFRSRESRRQETVVRTRDTRRQEPVVRSRDSHRQEPVVRSGTTRHQEPVRQTRERAPAAQVHRQSEPVRRDQAPRQQQSGSRDNQSSRSSESRGSSESHSRQSGHDRGESRERRR